MNNRYWMLGRKALSIALLAVGFLLVTVDATSQYPQLPQLALVNPTFQSPTMGSGTYYPDGSSLNPNYTGNGTYYPDGRIWVPRAPDGGTREILIPVLVNSNWVNKGSNVAEPIYSFKFKLQYDERALIALGVQKIGANQGDTLSIAQDFNIVWDDSKDVTYLKSIDPTSTDSQYGRRIRIVGTSTRPLPATTLDQRNETYLELLYIRFRVVASTGIGTNQPLIITNDTLRYNDRSPVGPQFPGDGQHTGLSGIDNSGGPIDPVEPTRPGIVYLNVTELPAIKFAEGTAPNVHPSPLVTDESLWIMDDPMTVDSNGSGCSNFPFPDNANREVVLSNGTGRSRLTDVTLQSDQPWLQFQAIARSGYKSPVPTSLSSPTRKGYVDFIDRGILVPPQSGASTVGKDPLGNPLDPQALLAGNGVLLKIICEPKALPPNSPAGLYIGYITVYSPVAKVAPVRLKVLFYYFRQPMEPNETSDVSKWSKCGHGINLTVENSASIVQMSKLIFGAGAEATDGVDQLFGESKYAAPLSGFGARWYPDPINIPNGMSDQVGRSDSRDIRNANTDSTLLYLCRFNAGGAQNYPIVITWDVNDFPLGSQLYLRDTINGSRFSVNMRQATSLGGTKFSYTITDAKLTSFIIEYTPPHVVRFPQINKGWNLVSMPVLPGNTTWNQVYQNAQAEPIYFAANDYRNPPNSLLEFGRGYFVKYGDIRDEYIAGIRVNGTSDGTGNLNYKVRMEDGWSTIGAMSAPKSVTSIRVVHLDGQTNSPVVSGDVYRYNTDKGYESVSRLDPGFGYWVNISKGPGYLSIKENDPRESVSDNPREIAINASSKVTISDNGHREGTVYLMNSNLNIDMNQFNLPPVPPAGMFDVRFNNGRYIDNSDERVINFRGTEYPVAITIENPTANYNVIDTRTNTVLGTIEQGKTSSVVIDNYSVKSVKIMSASSGVLSNGLAFNNATSVVSYSIADNANVTMKVYNMLGQEVATLVSEAKNAGSYNVNFDASNLQSGVYMVKMTAGNYTETTSITVVK